MMAMRARRLGRGGLRPARRRAASTSCASATGLSASRPFTTKAYGPSSFAARIASRSCSIAGWNRFSSSAARRSARSRPTDWAICSICSRSGGRPPGCQGVVELPELALAVGVVADRRQQLGILGQRRLAHWHRDHLRHQLHLAGVGGQQPLGDGPPLEGVQVGEIQHLDRAARVPPHRGVAGDEAHGHPVAQQVVGQGDGHRRPGHEHRGARLGAAVGGSPRRRGGGRQALQLRQRRLHLVHERAQRLGPGQALAVDEEGGGAADVGVLGQLQVGVHPRLELRPVQRRPEPGDVQRQGARVLLQRRQVQPVLRGEQPIVHLPELALLARRQRRLGGQRRGLVERQRQVLPHQADLVGVGLLQLAQGGDHPRAERALELAVRDDGDGRLGVAPRRGIARLDRLAQGLGPVDGRLGAGGRRPDQPGHARGRRGRRRRSRGRAGGRGRGCQRQPRDTGARRGPAARPRARSLATGASGVSRPPHHSAAATDRGGGHGHPPASSRRPGAGAHPWPPPLRPLPPRSSSLRSPPRPPAPPGRARRQRRQRQPPALPVLAVAGVQLGPHLIQAVLQPPAHGPGGDALAAGDLRGPFPGRSRAARSNGNGSSSPPPPRPPAAGPRGRSAAPRAWAGRVVGGPHVRPARAGGRRCGRASGPGCAAPRPARGARTARSGGARTAVAQVSCTRSSASDGVHQPGSQALQPGRVGQQVLGGDG